MPRPGPYRWTAVDVNAWGVYTNTSPAGSYRAFGASHLQWAGEAQIDEIGRRCGLDGVQMRELNLLEPGEYVRPGGKPLDADLKGDIRKCAANLDWDSPKPPNVGRGVSVGLLAAGAHPVSTAFARMEADGKVVLYVSSTDMGQGARTVFSQIVAEELALTVDDVRVMGGDTQVTPYDRSTGASRSTTLAGMAVLRSGAELREQLFDIASQQFGLPNEALEMRDGAIWHEDESLTYPDLIKSHFGMVGGELIGRGEVRPEHGSGSYAEGPVFWEVCIGGIELEVDPDTGKITLLKTASVADVGKAINPKQVETQEMGGLMQGIGNAIYEEMIYDPSSGQLTNGSLFDYHNGSARPVSERAAHVALVERGHLATFAEFDHPVNDRVDLIVRERTDDRLVDPAQRVDERHSLHQAVLGATELEGDAGLGGEIAVAGRVDHDRPGGPRRPCLVSASTPRMLPVFHRSVHRRPGGTASAPRPRPACRCQTMRIPSGSNQCVSCARGYCQSCRIQPCFSARRADSSTRPLITIFSRSLRCQPLTSALVAMPPTGANVRSGSPRRRGEPATAAASPPAAPADDDVGVREDGNFAGGDENIHGSSLYVREGGIVRATSHRKPSGSLK